MQGIAVAGNELAVDDDEEAVKDAKGQAELARMYLTAITIIERLRDPGYQFLVGTLSPQLQTGSQPPIE